MTLLEAAKQARNALGPTAPECCGCAVEWEIAITALDQAIAEAETYGFQQEPVVTEFPMKLTCTKCGAVDEGMLIIEDEPKREWQGLTQQDIDIAFDDTQEGGGFDDFARAIEAKLKEKNT